MIRGSQLLRAAVRDHLRARLPGQIDRRTAAGADLPYPDPEEYHPSWIPVEQVTNWPALMVVARNGDIVERLDWVDGNPVDLWAWTIRVYVWARGDSYPETSDRLEQLAGCIAETFLAYPQMGDPSDRMVVQPRPMRVSLSSVEDWDGASIAGAYVEAVATMAETAELPPLGTAETVDLAPEVKT